MDYRDIPNTKYDKITCLEMAEHVGVKNFGTFLAQVLCPAVLCFVRVCCGSCLRCNACVVQWVASRYSH